MKKNIICFSHIPKASGTTFKTILGQNYSIRKLQTFYEHRQHEKNLKELRNNLFKINIVIGHIGYGIHEYIDANVQYLTFLRDPIARVVSAYKHVLRDVNHHCHKHVKNSSMYDFLKNTTEETFSNSQTRYISGSKLKLQFSPDEDTISFYPFANENEMLETAKKNIRDNFYFVGITELFEQSILELQKRKFLSNIYFGKLNSAHQKEFKVDPSVIEIIKERNKLDIVLYDFAKARFMKEFDVSYFNKHYYNFKRKNALIGKPISYFYRGYHKIYSKINKITF